MTKNEALKLALQALENLDGIDTETECVTIDVGEEITAIREVFAQPEQEPVAAQHRFRHPQKTMPDWSAWQPCKIKHGRPAWEFDSQGYEVEYRELYTSPPAKPVAWHHPECEGQCIACLIEQVVQEAYGNQGLGYLQRHLTSTQPKPWVGLTDEEIAVIAAACGGLASDFVVDVARSIEQAHGITGESK